MSYLASLLDLRSAIKQTEHQIDTLMPDALSEALDNFSEENHVVFRAQHGKVVLTLRKRLPTLRDSQDLARLHELIIATQTSLAQRRRSQLERLNTQILQHQAAIKSLEQERDGLLTNKALLQLKTNFIQTQENHSWMEPNLSVYLF